MAQISKKARTKREQLAEAKKADPERSRREELDEICVVGYQCKLFGDDERARAINRGEHLIPWMGDSSLMIDRYDGRGHLLSLSDLEARQWGRPRLELSAEEERIEALCDEERYMALHKDMLEEELRQEEEIKRLNQAIAATDSSYNEVAFAYDAGKDEYDPMRPTEDEEQFSKTPPKCKSPELEEPFIAPAELNIPLGIQMPGTKKTHRFMEKTAMFIMGQGAQMEIILKTKQANNPQFSFLQFDHYLNPYYKHLLKYIKSGKYRPRPEEEEEKADNHKQGGNNRVRRHSMTSSNEEDDDDDDDNENSGYLHPSLLGHSKPRPTPMQTGATTINPSTSLPLTSSATSSSSFPLVDYTKPPPAMGYHDTNFLPPAADPLMVGPLGYYDQANVYSMFPPPPPPPPSEVALSLPSVPPPHYTGMDQAYILPNPHQSIQSVPHPDTALPHQDTPSVPHQTSAPAGVSSLVDAGEPEGSRVIPPPPDIQPVIDKLAKFVAKNGSDFEASVRSKSDPRFDFLLPWHKYNAYYVQKKKMYVQEMGGKQEEEEEETTKKVSVSFSIKPKMSKEERPLERKSALPVESSDSETEEERVPSRIPPPKHLEMTDTLSRDNRPMGDGVRGRDIPRGEVRGDGPEGQGSWGDFPGQPTFNPAYRGQTFAGEAVEQVPFEGPYQETVHREPVMYRELANPGYLEYPDPYTDAGASQAQAGQERGRASEEDLQLKQVKQRLEDRLASAAREKMASASKERIQQMERRKKAAVFLSMIKDRPQAGAAAELDSMEPEPNNIPAETVSPPEKQRRTDSHGDRKKHRKHRHKHGSSRRSASPDRKHKRPPRSYQVGNPRSREADTRPRARSISPGGRSRQAPQPKTNTTVGNKSSKGRRRSRSRSTSPVRLPRATESQSRRSSSLGATSLPVKSRSQSPVPVNQDTTPPPDTAPAPPTATPIAATPIAVPPIAATPIVATPMSDTPMGGTTSQVNSGSNSAKEPVTGKSEANGSASKDADFQDQFRAKIRAMLAATRQTDFKPS